MNSFPPCPKNGQTPPLPGLRIYFIDTGIKNKNKNPLKIKNN